MRMREQAKSTPQKQDTPAAKRKAARKAANNKRSAGSKKEVRALRSELAARFREKLEQAGSVENRLELLTPRVKPKGEGGQTGRTAAQKAKAARKAAKKAAKLKLGYLAKSKNWLAKRAASKAAKKERQKLEAKALTGHRSRGRSVARWDL